MKRQHGHKKKITSQQVITALKNQVRDLRAEGSKNRTMLRDENRRKKLVIRLQEMIRRLLILLGECGDPKTGFHNCSAHCAKMLSGDRSVCGCGFSNSVDSEIKEFNNLLMERQGVK